VGTLGGGDSAAGLVDGGGGGGGGGTTDEESSTPIFSGSRRDGTILHAFKILIVSIPLLAPPINITLR